MSKQTSVDFLMKEFSAIFGKVNFTSMQGLLLKDAVEKARHMHEIEITEAFEDGNEQGFLCKEGIEYYNETYKKEEK
jgi:hypothetical protein